ncbi:MAG: hypothetical protein ACXAB6_02670 [Candidatus Thorarchaeota archaeon]
MPVKLALNHAESNNTVVYFAECKVLPVLFARLNQVRDVDYFQWSVFDVSIDGVL